MLFFICSQEVSELWCRSLHFDHLPRRYNCITAAAAATLFLFIFPKVWSSKRRRERKDWLVALKEEENFVTLIISLFVYRLKTFKRDSPSCLAVSWSFCHCHFFIQWLPARSNYNLIKPEWNYSGRLLALLASIRLEWQGETPSLQYILQR